MLFSIITIVKNNAVGLKRTVESAKLQTFLDWELIIIYTDSEDETVKISKSLSSKFDNVSSHYLPADGIYTAMNFGLSFAKGRYIWFMNSGDIFASEDVLTYAAQIMINHNLSILIGGYAVDGLENSYSYRQQNLTALRFAINRRMSHQATIIKLSDLKKKGIFDTKYKVAADFDLILKILIDNRNNCRVVAKILSINESGGFSDNNLNIVRHEKKEIRSKYLNKKMAFIINSGYDIEAFIRDRVKI